MFCSVSFITVLSLYDLSRSACRRLTTTKQNATQYSQHTAASVPLTLVEASIQSSLDLSISVSASRVHTFPRLSLRLKSRLARATRVRRSERAEKSCHSLRRVKWTRSCERVFSSSCTVRSDRSNEHLFYLCGDFCPGKGQKS